MKGGDAKFNARALLALLDGEPGPYRDIVIYNAAGALIVAGKTDNLKSGAALAAASIDDGKSRAVLDNWISITNADKQK